MGQSNFRKGTKTSCQTQVRNDAWPEIGMMQVNVEDRFDNREWGVLPEWLSVRRISRGLRRDAAIVVLFPGAVRRRRRPGAEGTEIAHSVHLYW